jgi:UDP-N-acetylmuramyl pentapeptide phosphotransferase/UDP-N-acetylglucosamine-1-phosphate transferase
LDAPSLTRLPLLGLLLIAVIALSSFTNFIDGLDGLVAGCLAVALIAVAFQFAAP